MHIWLGSKRIRLDWLPLLIYFAVVLFPMELGQTFLHGPPDLDNPVEGPGKIIAGIALVITLAKFKRLSPFLRTLFLIVAAYIALLALESLYTYGTPFKYPHVFSKFFVIFYPTAVYVIYRGAKEWVFTWTFFMLILVFMVDQVVHHPEVLTLGSFMNTERGMHAANVYFLMAAWLFAFNSYLPKLNVGWLLTFFVLTALILFLNHRTVWLASATAMALNLAIINLRGKERYSPTAFTPLIVIPIIAVMLLFSYVFSENPEIIDTLTERITDIEKADEQGTGKWRLVQFQSYLPFVFDHPLIGMRFRGFELPVQFIADQTGKAVFTENTGHHFHSYYMDSLFYHGLAGFLVLSSIFIYTFRQILVLPVKLPFRLVGMGVWALVCLQYGLSYPLDDFHFAMAGLALAAIDTHLDNVDATNLQQYLTAQSASDDAESIELPADTGIEQS